MRLILKKTFQYVSQILMFAMHFSDAKRAVHKQVQEPLDKFMEIIKRVFKKISPRQWSEMVESVMIRMKQCYY